VSDAPWPRSGTLRSGRLVLEPLRPEHAGDLFPVLDDPRLHTFTGGAPDTREELRARVARQAAGVSPDGRRGWLNWVLRRREGGDVVGTVQATLTRVADGPAESPGALQAELAWVVGSEHQGHGYATEAAEAVVCWLAGCGVVRRCAHVHPDHVASAAVARRLGLRPSDRFVDGERLWTT